MSNRNTGVNRYTGEPIIEVMAKDLGMVTAYAYAVAGGYTGTEEEFTELLGNIATDLEEIENLSVTVTTLPAGSQATASYSDGVLSLGIPKGDTGLTPALSIGTVTTLPPEDDATVTITGPIEAPVLNFGLVKGDKGDTGEVSQAELDEAVTDLKADITENGIVPSSEQLISDNYLLDTDPYTFRPSPRGDREFDEIVGASVVENQLVNSNNKSGSTSFDADTTNYFKTIKTLTGDDKINLIQGHKYFVSVSIVRSISTNNQIGINIGGQLSVGIDNGVSDGNASSIREASSTATITTIQCNNYNGKHGFNAGDTVSYDNYNIIDLTAKLGTTIADHIYALEQATAGSGVAFYKKYFGDGYKAYDSGSLKSVEGLVSHDMTGKNLYDKSYGRGVRGAKLIPVGSTIYAMQSTTNTFGVYITYTDGTSASVSLSPLTKAHIAVTKPIRSIGISEAAYAVIVSQNADMMLSLADFNDIEPYVKHSYPLDSSVTLRGLYKLVDGKLKADGDVYESDGTVTRKYGVVDLGTLTWNYFATGDYFYATISDRFANGTAGAGVCARYPFFATQTDAYLTANMPDKSFGFTSTSSYRYMYIRDSAYTTETALKESLSGVYLVYELATPTIETADPYQSPQIVSEYGTEEYVSTSVIPIGHNTRYPDNLRKKIDGLPWDFSSIIAPTESGTASRNYTVGQLLIMGNTLYQVTQNIAGGGAITPNTNCTATTLSEVIANL